MDFLKIIDDFTSRLDIVKEDYNRHLDYLVMQKLLELDSISSTGIWSLFEKYWNNRTGFNTLEGIESINSFVGNFYDDAVFHVKWEKDELAFDIRERAGLDTSNCFKPNISTVDGDDKGISEDELVEVLQKLIDKEKTRNERFKRILI